MMVGLTCFNIQPLENRFFFLGIAEVCNNDGDEECRKNEYKNAVHSYTEGIEVKCEDKELNAKLYSNRATAHCFLGECIPQF